MALSDVKAGDEVIEVEFTLGIQLPHKRRLVTVDRVTSTLIITGKDRWRIKDGEVPGGRDRFYSYSSRRWIVPADERERELLAESNAAWADEDRRSAAITIIRRHSLTTLPTSALERIVSIIKEGENA